MLPNGGNLHFYNPSGGCAGLFTGGDPAAFSGKLSVRPCNARSFIPVDLCGGNNGRLNIEPNGVVTVGQQSGDPFSNATCFTSLDGASFAA